METLRTRTATEELDLYSRFLNCDRFERIGADILGPLAHEVRASSAVFLQFLQHEDGMMVGQGVTFALNPRSLSSYAEHFHHKDPVAHATRALCRDPKAPDVVALTELADMSKLRSSEYYRDFLRQFGIDDVIGVFLPVRTFTQEVLCIGLHRQAGAERFARHEKMRLRQLRPILTAALARMTLQSAVESADGAFHALSEAPNPVGLVIFNARFDVVYSNKRGVTDLGFNDGALAAQWLEAIQRAAPASSDAVVTIQNSGAHIHAQILKRVLSDGAVRYVVTTCDADDQKRFETRCKSIGLSAREIDVAQLVAAGLGNEALGDRLAISVRTVENHLRAIFAKAGVRSRTQLMAQLFGQF
jgi:DNA-binding CsgD family transcriptional regulator